MALASPIGERVEAFRARVDRVVAAEGRPPGAVTILGVTKMQPRAAVLAAIAVGITDIGENYLQEAREKYAGLPPARKHFIGHLQTNKAKAILGIFEVVQSIDRLEAGLATSGAADRGRALARLEVLLAHWRENPDGGSIAERIDTASDDEMFRLLDTEFGIS